MGEREKQATGWERSTLLIVGLGLLADWFHVEIFVEQAGVNNVGALIGRQMGHVFEFETGHCRNDAPRKANVGSDNGNSLGGLTEQLEAYTTPMGIQGAELRSKNRLGLGRRHGQEASTAANLVFPMVAAGITGNTNNRRDNLGGLINHVYEQTGNIEFDNGGIKTVTGKGTYKTEKEETSVSTKKLQSSVAGMIPTQKYHSPWIEPEVENDVETASCNVSFTGMLRSIAATKHNKEVETLPLVLALGCTSNRV